MHLCYVDEAGSTGTDLTNPEQPIFVMAGLLVSDEKWRKTEQRVTEVLTAAFDGELPTGYELHACDLLAPNDEGPYHGWGRDRRNALALDLLRVIDERSHQVLLVAVDKPRLATETSPTKNYGFDWKEPWDLSLAAMLTLVEEHLRSDKTGRTSTGMVLIDHEERYLDLVRQRSRERRAAGGWRQLRKVIEIGFSAVSHANAMIQLTDLVAFTMKKHYEAKAGYRPNWPPEAVEFYSDCRAIVWQRVQSKTFKLNKVKVPADLVEFKKAVTPKG